MPSRSPRPCARTGCSKPAQRGGSCALHTSQVRARTDKARGSSSERGYDGQHRQQFRHAVLAEMPFCVLCGVPSTVADHYPRSRRELVEAGLDPNDPQYGRGLCDRCHNRHTAQAQPGGFNRQGGRHHDE